MAVPKKRTSKSRIRNRRSHHALAAPQLQPASDGRNVARRLHKAIKLGLVKIKRT
ncbi:MAG TPA: 50S ribosomal protein L32 [Candidatus Dormibacteraeota bacterium]|nr:50S ribosomal protein L32 [Candidatus Dormibacteraeota bacterium]